MADLLKFLVITGVSGGVGLAAARAFLARGYRGFGSLRTVDDAARTQTELRPLLFDVTDAVLRAAADVARTLGNAPLTGLLNNAGVAFGGPLQYQPLAVSASISK